MTASARRELANFIVLSKDGEWGQSEPFDDSVEMLVVRGTDFPAVREGDWSKVPRRHVARRHAELKSLADNDILIETAGGSRDRPTGRTLFVKPGIIGVQELPVTCASFARFVRLDPSLVEPAFVFWWLQQMYESRQLLAFHTQHTGVARFQWTTCSHSIAVPSVGRSTQRKIAAVLSAYDDLISNNVQRIARLDEVAQRIYREWFVDYRYPGHDGVPLVDPEDQRIPRGWDLHRLGDDVEFVYGKALKSGARREGTVPVFGSSGVIGHHDESLTGGPGVIVGRKGNVGAVYWSDGPFFAIDTTYWIRSRLPLTYLYFAFQTMEFLDSHAAVPGLNREQAYSLPLVVPDTSSLSAFERVVLDLFELRQSLENSTALLRSSRDLLLRQLLSGEFDSSRVSIAAPEGAA